MLCHHAPGIERTLPAGDTPRPRHSGRAVARGREDWAASRTGLRSARGELGRGVASADLAPGTWFSGKVATDPSPRGDRPHQPSCRNHPFESYRHAEVFHGVQGDIFGENPPGGMNPYIPRHIPPSDPIESRGEIAKAGGTQHVAGTPILATPHRSHQREFPPRLPEAYR